MQSDTDKMINVFNDSLKCVSDNQMLIRQFDAVGSKQIGEAVHSSVTASVFAAEAKKKLHVDQSPSHLPTFPIGASCQFCMQWKHQLLVPSLSSYFRMVNPGTTLIYSLRGVSTTVLILPRTHARIVLKELKNKSKDASLDYFYMKILEIQTVASAYAREFNHTLNKQSILLPPISFPPVDIIDMWLLYTAHTCYILQEFIDGTFKKFNTNTGIVCSIAHPSLTLYKHSVTTRGSSLGRACWYVTYRVCRHHQVYTCVTLPSTPRLELANTDQLILAMVE